jgi:hypothetical protein
MQSLEPKHGWLYTDFANDDFTVAYLKAAVASYPFNPTAFDYADLAMPAIEQMLRDCAKFKTDNLGLLTINGVCRRVSWSRAGEEFWTVRNDPKKTFSLRFWQVPKAPLLTKAALKFGRCRLFVGREGLIYIDQKA